MVIDYTGGREQLLQYNENVLYVDLGGNYRCKIPPMLYTENICGMCPFCTFCNKVSIEKSTKLS